MNGWACNANAFLRREKVRRFPQSGGPREANPDMRASGAPGLWAALLGEWRASGLREGIDACDGKGRLHYYPVGRGGAAFLPDGIFRLTAVNGAGVFVREGAWRVEGELLSVQIGESRGLFRCCVSAESLALSPERAFFRCAERLLHSPRLTRRA